MSIAVYAPTGLRSHAPQVRARLDTKMKLTGNFVHEFKTGGYPGEKNTTVKFHSVDGEVYKIELKNEAGGRHLDPGNEILISSFKKWFEEEHFQQRLANLSGHPEYTFAPNVDIKSLDDH